MISKPKFKIGRRLGAGVYDKCQTQKFKSSNKSAGFKGVHSKALSEFGIQLIEKQKVRFFYGITERQLSNYVRKQTKGGGVIKLYEILESRLDNVIYRMGLANSRRAARQMVSHGHFIVNDHKVTVPSHSVEIGDIVKIREGSKKSKIFSDLEKKMKNSKIPEWLSFDINTLQGKILSKPKNPDQFLDLNVVLEFYSH